jgi:hypothetical protein
MLLPELSERDASGEKAGIYAEMKELGAVPMVALIFRHLATLAGRHRVGVGCAAPRVEVGPLQEAAWHIAREAPLDPLAAISRPALKALGVDDAGLAEIRVVLAAYNRANPENMLSVLCLSRLARDARPRCRSMPRVGATARAGPLVAMGDVAILPRRWWSCSTWWPLRRTRSAARRAEPVPALPASPRVPGARRDVAAAALRRRLDRRGVESIRAAMNAPRTHRRGPLRASRTRSRHRDGCARFGEGVIPQMIVAGALLERALPAAS